MKVGISQSNYIPWKGYFDFIHSCDVFVLYDIAQFTKNDWRNRNKIVTDKHQHWLTIPVRHQCLHQSIEDTKIAAPNWNKKHLKSLTQAYGSSKKFLHQREEIDQLYLKDLNGIASLSVINHISLKWWLKKLNINTTIITSQMLDKEALITLKRSERLQKICQLLNATTYIAQPQAKSYLNTSLFTDKDIEVEWFEYLKYENTNSIFDFEFSE